MNGGNAAVPREDPNLESSGDGGGAAAVVEAQDSGDKAQLMAGGNADAQEVNGELRSTPRKHGTLPRRRLRKFKANFAGTMEIDAAEAPATRGRKHKLSEHEEASSEESEEFNGFESQGLDLQPGSHVLDKLIGKIHPGRDTIVDKIDYTKYKNIFLYIETIG